MSQASGESRAYSSWNRTPGKPQHNKMSTISSSTDSGVGRTPTWGCDTDCGIVGGESGVWGNGCVAPSTDLIEGNKRGSWDEADTQENCKTANLSFGFTSQWNASSGLPTVGSQISTWAMTSTNSVERTPNDNSTIDNCWNLPSRPSDDDFLTCSTSIWSSNPHRQLPDHDSDFNTPSTNCATEINTSVHHNYHSTLITSKNVSNNKDLSNIDKEKCEELDDVSEAQTWAQAAGKGVQTTATSEDGVHRREIDEKYETIINRVEGWGSHNVDQSTPWNVTEDVDLSSVAVCSDIIAQRSRSTTESNVWTNEPPNGVGVWESHYEMIGEKTSRWAVGAPAAVKSAKNSWEVPAESVVSSQWGERDCDSSVWNANTNNITETRVNKPVWISGISQTVKSESAVVGAIGTGNRGNSSNYPLHRNNSALHSTINISSPPGDLNESTGLRQAFFPPQNLPMITNNRSNPNFKVRPTANLGFRKEDAQGALFNNGMDINRVMNQSSVNQSNLMAQRNDWNMPQDNFRSNPGEVDNCVIGSGNNNFMLPSFGGGNSSAMKQHMLQQHMQMNMSGNRNPSENQMFEKQIMKEINQLFAKQQDLIQRITCLRSIAGSHAIIQEMTRTLSEVRQQLNTQQATLKVIKSQIVPNGVITNNMSLPRPMQSGQTQSNMISDLSLHINDMKLQKRNMDLWPQGNLPSSNTISGYVGMDKPSSGMFYNGPGPNNQMDGSMMPQSFNQNNNKPLSQTNFIQSAAHRHSGQMWPSRPSMSGLASGSQTSHMNNSDFHLPTEDGDSSMGYQTLATAPGELRNNTSTTALSLSQAPFSSSGNGASTAFTSRDISFASANISEFVPGQPWPGISYSQRDDPNVTLGAGQRSLLSVTNDHLEKLANSNVNSMMTSSDVCANSNILNRLPSNTNGLSSGASITYVLIRDLPSHINIEMLRNVFTPQSFPGLIQMHPNLPARWVLLHFTCNEETLKAFKNLYGKVGVVELVPDQEMNQRLQHNNCASVGPVLPFSGMMDFHNQHNHQQQHQQSHYLH